MENSEELWVMGHKVKLVPSIADYDMFIGASPPNVPGPPPHLHKTYHELFVILKGEMEFIVNGEKQVLKEGESLTLPPQTPHTFHNSGTTINQWLNVHSPKGFSSFLHTFGVPVSKENAFEMSVSESMISKVSSTAASFDMHILT